MPDVRTGTENERGSGGETLIGGRTERAAVSGGTLRYRTEADPAWSRPAPIHPARHGADQHDWESDGPDWPADSGEGYRSEATPGRWRRGEGSLNPGGPDPTDGATLGLGPTKGTVDVLGDPKQ